MEDVNVSRSGDQYFLKCLRYMGDHPSFPQEEVVFHKGLRRGDLFLDFEGRNWVPLYPFILPMTCSHCVADYEISAFTPSPPGPEWGERVVAIVHHVPETEESEGGYAAATLGGTPLGVAIIAEDADTAGEAIDRLVGALRVFGYSGAVAVEDATYVGGMRRYEIGPEGQPEASF